jgi:hypothetical protein
MKKKKFIKKKKKIFYMKKKILSLKKFINFLKQKKCVFKKELKFNCINLFII